MLTKTCTKCNQTKPISEFHKNKKLKDGVNVWCKTCTKDYRKSYNKNTKEKRATKSKQYRDSIKNKPKETSISEKHCTYCNQIKPISEFHKRKDTPSGYRSHCKICTNNSNKKFTKHWNSKNKEHRNQYMTERRKDSSFRITENLRRRLLSALNGKTKSKPTLKLLGCSIEYLKEHLQQTAIGNGYINFDINSYSGKDYHIDHIIPCASFDLSNPKEQQRCFHYSNLQILSAFDNLIKSDKLL